jgi:hypothetical protein
MADITEDAEIRLHRIRVKLYENHMTTIEEIEVTFQPKLRGILDQLPLQNWAGIGRSTDYTA